MSIRGRVAQLQGIYYAATGLWGLFDLDTFEWVTGAKTDDWLVKTVAALVLAIGISLLIASRRSSPGPESAFLGLSSALGLLSIDAYYVRTADISAIYLADACVEAAIAIGWSFPRRRQFRVGLVRRATPYWRSHESR